MTENLSWSAESRNGHHHESALKLALGWSGVLAESTSRLVWNATSDVGLYLHGETNPEPNTNSAESLLKLFEKSGVSALSALNARLSGVIVDRRLGECHIFNDRYGLARIYCHESHEAFYFATEAKSLLAVLPHLRKLDPRGLAEYISVGCVLQNRTLFEGISILPPASVWTFTAGPKAKRQIYFDPRTWEEQEPLTPREYSHQLCETFGRICGKYLVGTTPPGLSLTGGLDSRMILAWAKAAPGTLPCYTFGGPYRDCADVQIARRLASISKQPHSTLRVGSDFFRQFPELAEQSVHGTDGSMDVSGSVEIYVNKLARQVSPIRLTGNYGSEILRGNIAFTPRLIERSHFAPEFRPLLDEAADTYRRERIGHRLTFIAFKQVPWYHFARYATERLQLTPRSPFLDNELVGLAYRVPPELLGSPRPLLDLISHGNQAFDHVRTDRAFASRTIPIMGHLTHHWHEFTARAEYAYDYGMPTWLARVDTHLGRLRLEKLFLGRHKFYHFRIWYRDNWKPYLDSVFTNETSACFIPGLTKRLVNEHTTGKANHTLALHKILSVQLINQLIIGAPCRS